MSDVEVIQVIHTRLLRRGKGKPGDTMRIIDQYWLMDGSLLFEFDPYPNETEQEQEQEQSHPFYRASPGAGY